jgi:uncharacterized membrane protein
MKKNNFVHSIAFSGIAASIIFVFSFVLKFPLGFSSNAYINLGDVAILIFTYLLGFPIIIASGVGSLLSDLASGAIVYAIPTLLIKSLMSLSICFSLKSRNYINFFISALLAEIIMLVGYFSFDILLIDMSYGLINLGFNSIQLGMVVILSYPIYKIAKTLVLTYKTFKGKPVC